MTFGEALELVKQGKLISRQGWNGKGMFIFQRPEDSIHISTVITQVKSLPAAVKSFYTSRVWADSENQMVKFTPYLCMKAADDSIVNGWLASQTDMLANDWSEFSYGV